MQLLQLTELVHANLPFEKIANRLVDAARRWVCAERLSLWWLDDKRDEVISLSLLFVNSVREIIIHVEDWIVCEQLVYQAPHATDTMLGWRISASKGTAGYVCKVETRESQEFVFKTSHRSSHLIHFQLRHQDGSAHHAVVLSARVGRFKCIIVDHVCRWADIICWVSQRLASFRFCD